MKDLYKILVTLFVGTLVGLLMGWGITYHHYQHLTPEKIYFTDTITLTQERIVEKTRYINTVRLDTIRDTIVINGHDTVVGIEIPIDAFTYRDTVRTDTTSSTIQIDYSGYKARLDGVQYSYTYFPKTPVKTKKNGGFRQFVGVGVQVGAGLGISTTPRFEPYVGVGLTYGWGWTW